MTHKLFENVKEHYLDRQGGYLRIIKKGLRKGDGAPISIVQLIQSEERSKAGKKKTKKTVSKKTASKRAKATDKAQKAEASNGADAPKAEKKSKAKAEPDK